MSKTAVQNIVEIYRPVIGYEGLYEVSNMGNIRSVDRVVVEKTGKINALKGLALKKCRHKDGYLHVTLCKNCVQKKVLIHRLVCQAFLDNPNEYDQVNHLNGRKDDNRLENLEWCNNSINQIHAFSRLNKTRLTGKDHPNFNKRPVASIAVTSKKVICTETGRIWNSITECWQSDFKDKYKFSTFKSMLNGNAKNKTTIKHLTNG